MQRIFSISPHIQTCAATAAFCVTMSGCGAKDAAKEISSGVKEASESVEDAAANLSDAIEKLAKIDPIALNRLLDENQGLRTQLEDATSQLGSTIAPSGRVDLAERNVRIFIDDHRGTFYLNGWVDDRARAQFWSDISLADSNLNLNFFDAKDVERWRLLAMGDASSSAFVDWWPHFVSRLEEHADEVAEGAFQQNASLTADVDPVDLNPRFGASGLHTIFLEITPTKTDRYGIWSIEGRIVLERESSQEVVLLFAADSKNPDYATHSLGSPLPELRYMISVRARD